MAERDIQSAILSWLNIVVGLRAWRRNVGSFAGEYKGKKRFVRFNDPGQSDIWFLARNAVHGEIEVKRPGGIVSAAQQAFLVEIAQADGIAIIAHSLDEAASELKRQYLRRGWIWNDSWSPQ